MNLSAVNVACIYGYLDIVKLLMEKDDVSFNRGLLFFGIAAKNGHLDIVK